MLGSTLPYSIGALDRRWDDDAVWEQRLRDDRETAARHQTPELQAITDELLSRAITGRASSFALTGSTALDRRTRVSDLDFYVVGAKPAAPRVDEEIDLFAVDPDEFKHRLSSGDDYLHWTLRFGLILHDDGPIRWALLKTVREKLWPDPAIKAVQARRAVEMAFAILRSGDHSAAVEQCRIAFSLAARWWLLRHGEFPRARRDLPDQLSSSSKQWLGDALLGTIFEDPRDADLEHALERLQAVLSGEAHHLAVARS